MLMTLLCSCGTSIENAQLQNTEITTQETPSETSAVETQVTTTAPITTTVVTTTTTAPVTTTTVTTTTAPVTTTTITTTTTPQPLGFADDDLISLAKSLHDVACEMAWNYYHGTPYVLDYDNYTQDEYGNTYFLVEDENITSLEDVKNDWLEIFSSKYNEPDFGNKFLEKDNRVYVNDGSRGADIYYDHTDITELVSTSEDGKEVFFKAVSQYVDPNDNSITETKTDEFSIILEDGSYHVGKFTLPF